MNRVRREADVELGLSDITPGDRSGDTRVGKVIDDENRAGVTGGTSTQKTPSSGEFLNVEIYIEKFWICFLGVVSVLYCHIFIPAFILDFTRTFLGVSPPVRFRAGSRSRIGIGAEIENPTGVEIECESELKIKSMTDIEISNTTGIKNKSGNQIRIDSKKQFIIKDQGTHSTYTRA
ncbi:hypothetical protein EVAR_23263_1 [Eumeta japonica]|uniref:Uncharacterized protein n=1 Tax=Eumeta variegata TaxID=151549 RepID=A0A4C1V6N6_EUMVA|nr:hypothetical protein EVAR_23263_1 [Eumeta japonica]